MGRAFFPPVNRKQAAAKAAKAKAPQPTTMTGREARRCPLPPGKKYGKLTVLRRAKKPKTDGLMVMCRCECGEELAISTRQLESGSVRSCGMRDHRKGDPDAAGLSEERIAAQAAATRAEQERIAVLYPNTRPPKPPRESDLALWEQGWMQ